MKKIISLVLILILLLCFISLFGCENKNAITIDGQKYEKIKLTATNYTKYISINSFIVDQNIELVELSGYGNRYDMSCIINITTDRKTNCYFDNVKIQYQVSCPPWICSSRTQTTSVAFDGESCASITFTKENVPIDQTVQYLTKTDNIVDTNAIEGYVLVPVN